MDVNFSIPRNPDGSRQERVRVWPKNEDMRKFLKHPTGGIKFAATVGESVEWPVDQFTYRRLSDGDVLLHAPGDEPQFRDAPPPPPPAEAPRQPVHEPAPPQAEPTPPPEQPT